MRVTPIPRLRAGRLVAATALLLGVPLAWTPGPPPVLAQVFVDGNRTCADIDPAYVELLKIDSGQVGTDVTNLVATAGTVSVTLDVDFTGPLSFSFGVDAVANTGGVAAVFVKAGSGGNLYTYSPPVGPGQTRAGLVGPDGKEISHVSFCVLPGTPTATATATLTSTPTTPSSTSTSTPSTPSPTPSPTASPTATNTPTATPVGDTLTTTPTPIAPTPTTAASPTVTSVLGPSETPAGGDLEICERLPGGYRVITIHEWEWPYYKDRAVL
ncbi:MAG TPA: hypothetical protein VFX49_06135, partial [Chloroflexota bacterium]|nr:hypothetical protein [Chloroflexota bacterium]